MDRRWLAILTVAMMLGMSACSSSRTDDDEAGTEDTAAKDAGTDAVPADSADNAPDAASGDQNLDSLPADDATPPSPQTSDNNSSTPPVASGDTTDYTIQSGDTLMKIAFETYGDLYQWRKIYDNNKDKIPDMNRLVAGTVIKVDRASGTVSIERNGEKYLIKVGDTLGGISDDVYGTQKKWRKLWENNRQMIKDPNRIYAGFYLYYLMTDQDQQEKQEFLKNKPAEQLGSADKVEPAPLEAAASAGAGGLIDPAGTDTAGGGKVRTPSAAPAK